MLLLLLLCEVVVGWVMTVKTSACDRLRGGFALFVQKASSSEMAKD